MLTPKAKRNVELGLSPSGKMLPLARSASGEQTGIPKCSKTLYVKRGYTYQSGNKTKPEHVLTSKLLTKYKGYKT